MNAGRMADGTSDTGLAELYRLHRAELLRFLTARTGDLAEAEDVVQDVWLRIGTASPGPIGNGKSYLFRIAHNLVLDRVRQRKRRVAREQSWSDTEHGPLPPSGEVPDIREDAARTLEEREEAARLASAIANLPEGARNVLRLHKIDGLSHGEVAARLGISKSGVEKHMAVAMKHLRRLLED